MLYYTRPFTRTTDQDQIQYLEWNRGGGAVAQWKRRSGRGAVEAAQRKRRSGCGSAEAAQRQQHRGGDEQNITRQALFNYFYLPKTKIYVICEIQA